MPAMSLALASSISTSRCIGTQYYNNRRHVVTPIPQRRSNKGNKIKKLCHEFIEYIRKN